MAAKAVKYFTDVSGGNRSYNKGDAYPAEGVKVPAGRVKELTAMGLISPEKEEKKKTK